MEVSMEKEDAAVIAAIRKILAKGDNAEVKKDKHGKLVVYSVKKIKCVG